MDIKVDKELVRGFVEEARTYIPLIKSAIEKLQSNSSRDSNLKEIHRLVQNIKGASSMLGVTELSDIANYIEKTLEDIATERINFDNEVLLFLRSSTSHVNKILDKLWEGTGDLKKDLEDVKDRFRNVYRDQELVDTTYVAFNTDKDDSGNNENAQSSILPILSPEFSSALNSIISSFGSNDYERLLSAISVFSNILQEYKFNPQSDITVNLQFLENCISELSRIVKNITKSNENDIRNVYISFANELINILGNFKENSKSGEGLYERLADIVNHHEKYNDTPDDDSGDEFTDDIDIADRDSSEPVAQTVYPPELVGDFIKEIKNTASEIFSKLKNIDTLEIIKPLIHSINGTTGMLASQYDTEIINSYTSMFKISGFMSSAFEMISSSSSDINNLESVFFSDCANAIILIADLRDSTYLPGINLRIQKEFERISERYTQLTATVISDHRNQDSDESGNKYLNSMEEIPSELFEIFRIEANEHIDIMKYQLNQYELNPQALTPLQEVRRGAHTIKGAASMVGLHVVSDLSFYIEESLDSILEYDVKPDEELCELIEKSCELIERLVMKGDSPETREELDEIKNRFDYLKSTQPVYGAEEQPEKDRIDDYDQDITDQDYVSTEGNYENKNNLYGSNDYNETTPASHLSSDIPDELLEVFLVEANEHFQNIGSYLNNISKDYSDKESLQEVRRSIHTIKGAAGMVGYNTVSKLAHRMEDLLDNLYEGSIVLNDRIVDLLYSTYDLLEELINSRPDSLELPDTLNKIYNQYSDLLGEESFVQKKRESEAEILDEADMQSEEVFEDLDTYLPPAADLSLSVKKKKEQAIRKPGEFVRIPIERLDELVNLVSELVVNRSTFEQHFGRFIQELDEMSPSLDRLRRVTGNLETEYEVITLGGGKIYSPAEQIQTTSGLQTYTSKSYDFDELQFDRYTLFHQHTRELTESASDIRAIGTQMRELTGDFDSYMNRQQRVTSEIQDKLMRLRMVPLSTIITKLHRTARVTASQQNKKVELYIEGEDVELDKTVLEEMADPLLHIVRNSVDHGIELPELRRALNKNHTGKIFLKSYYEGTQVVIEIGDDGAGLVPEVLRNAAVKSGFVSETESHKLQNDEINKLIFLPGFSSATQISEISGRGVGMDIVSNTVNKLKGTISVRSIPTKGVTFTIRLPMTLAITKVLLVKTSGELFAVPLASVSQIMRLEKGYIENLGDEKVIKIDNNLYPIIFLGEILNLRSISEESAISLPVLIMKIGERHIALVVEELLESREVVVKTLGTHLKRVHGITSATLMGDGSVVLIINPNDLVVEVPKLEYKLKPQLSREVRSGILDILIVDDSLSVRRVMSNLVKSHGWNPITSNDGVEALEIIQRSLKLPDVILLDIEMPRMDGYELTSTLRSQGQFANIPIIMITSRSGKKHRDKAFELGATEYLVKPYQDTELIALIERLTGKRDGTTLQ